MNPQVHQLQEKWSVQQKRTAFHRPAQDSLLHAEDLLVTISEPAKVSPSLDASGRGPWSVCPATAPRHPFLLARSSTSEDCCSKAVLVPLPDTGHSAADASCSSASATERSLDVVPLLSQGSCRVLPGHSSMARSPSTPPTAHRAVCRGSCCVGRLSEWGRPWAHSVWLSMSWACGRTALPDHLKLSVAVRFAWAQDRSTKVAGHTDPPRGSLSSRGAATKAWVLCPAAEPTGQCPRAGALGAPSSRQE